MVFVADRQIGDAGTSKRITHHHHALLTHNGTARPFIFGSNRCAVQRTPQRLRLALYRFTQNRYRSVFISPRNPFRKGLSFPTTPITTLVPHTHPISLVSDTRLGKISVLTRLLHSCSTCHSIRYSKQSSICRRIQLGRCNISGHVSDENPYDRLLLGLHSSQKIIKSKMVCLDPTRGGSWNCSDTNNLRACSYQPYTFARRQNSTRRTCTPIRYPTRPSARRANNESL